MHQDIINGSLAEFTVYQNQKTIYPQVWLQNCFLCEMGIHVRQYRYLKAFGCASDRFFR